MKFENGKEDIGMQGDKAHLVKQMESSVCDL
jgi:hypothetical protein